MDIHDTSEFIDFLTQISSDLEFEIPEFQGDLDKLEDEERVGELLYNSPIIRRVYDMHLSGHIDYEAALQKMVIALFNSKEHYRKQLEDHLMRNPAPIIMDR